MEQFRTELPITPAPSIDHGTSIVTTGSCFSDNIGQKLSESKFPTTVNPLGVCYNPISIHKALMMDKPDESMFVESQGTWRHFDFHSKFAAGSKDEVRDLIKKQLPFHGSDVLIVTYGTGWVYKHKVSDKIVANCHKRPQSEFEKVLLTADDIVNSFAELRGFLKPEQKVIITLSPVRHIKDTLELNSVSKAILRTAIYEIGKVFRNVDYFPAYEIMMDDLRDYRFYEADMIHPSEVAIEYIWNKFGERYFSEETKVINKKLNKIERSLKHRVFNEGTEEHKKFLRSVLKDLDDVSSRLDVSNEIDHIKSFLS
jgi:hypothetical protein